LDQYLAAAGWRPTEDALVKWSARNLWLELTLLSNEHLPEYPVPEGLISFLIREESTDQSSLNIIREVLDENGIKVFSTYPLSPDQREAASMLTRGANWPKEEGGGPAVLAVAIDTFASDYATIESWVKRMRKVKEAIRNKINQGRRKHPLGVLHSSDGCIHAAKYIEVVFGEEAQDIVATTYELTEPEKRQSDRAGT
jgi:hypothetical protein